MQKDSELIVPNFFIKRPEFFLSQPLYISEEVNMRIEDILDFDNIEETIDTLIAISVVAKRLAEKLREIEEN